jgi:hypothetical protein
LTPIRVPGGGIGVPAKGHPQSVHVGFPGVDYQLEVFEPMSGAAAREVKSGRIVAVGGTTPSQSATKAAATATQLKALPKTVGHPVYWIGARKGNTYELTRNADGSIVIRYLPAGDKVGSQKAYLAVATYPYPSPVAALKALATSKTLETIELAGGGIAVIDPKLPHNVHLAFPGESYQIEVYAPQDGQVAKIVRAGRVSALG